MKKPVVLIHYTSEGKVNGLVEPMSGLDRRDRLAMPIMGEKMTDWLDDLRRDSELVNSRPTFVTTDASTQEQFQQVIEELQQVSAARERVLSAAPKLIAIAQLAHEIVELGPFYGPQDAQACGYCETDDATDLVHMDRCVWVKLQKALK